MVSTLFTAFAMIATGQVGTASLDPSASRARSEWLAELEAETVRSTMLVEGQASGPRRR